MRSNRRRGFRQQEKKYCKDGNGKTGVKTNAERNTTTKKNPQTIR